MRYIEKDNITSIWSNKNIHPLRKYVFLQVLAKPDPLHPLYNLHPSVRLPLLSQLLKEQKGLCCYCMLRLDDNIYHIEHLAPQSAFKNEEVYYYNLFISCGNDKNTKIHCGHYKKENQIPKVISYFNPRTNERCENLFKYNLIGEILPKEGQNTMLDNYKSYNLLNTNTKSLLSTIEVLNLNCENLKIIRKRIAEAIYKLPDDRIQLEAILNNFKTPNNQTGFLDPMCEVSIFYLNEKLKRID